MSIVLVVVLFHGLGGKASLGALACHVHLNPRLSPGVSSHRVTPGSCGVTQGSTWQGLERGCVLDRAHVHLPSVWIVWEAWGEWLTRARAWLHICKQNKQDFFQLSLIPSDQEGGKGKDFGKQLLGTALVFWRGNQFWRGWEVTLASCEPSRFQGSAVLGGDIPSGVAFSAGPGHTFCCVVRERRAGQSCPSHFLLDAGMVN